LKRIVIKISGSIFYWDSVDKSLPPLVNVIKREATKRKISFVVVAGGGETSRLYINSARKFGGNEGILDDLGLKVAQLNAGLIVSCLAEQGYPVVPTSLDETIQAVELGKIVAVGGFHPGHSTNAVAALIGERIGADLFINATDVDGVYSADPAKVKEAKMFKVISVHKLKELIYRNAMVAGSYELMDLVAVNIIERAKLKTRVIRAVPDQLSMAIQGADVGTHII
jgi:uridylate kinase